MLLKNLQKFGILMSFHIDYEELLEKYKAIWTKIEGSAIFN